MVVIDLAPFLLRCGRVRPIAGRLGITRPPCCARAARRAPVPHITDAPVPYRDGGVLLRGTTQVDPAEGGSPLVSHNGAVRAYLRTSTPPDGQRRSVWQTGSQASSASGGRLSARLWRGTVSLSRAFHQVAHSLMARRPTTPDRRRNIRLSDKEPTVPVPVRSIIGQASASSRRSVVRRPPARPAGRTGLRSGLNRDEMVAPE